MGDARCASCRANAQLYDDVLSQGGKFMMETMRFIEWGCCAQTVHLATTIDASSIIDNVMRAIAW